MLRLKVTVAVVCPSCENLKTYRYCMSVDLKKYSAMDLFGQLDSTDKNALILWD